MEKDVLIIEIGEVLYVCVCVCRRLLGSVQGFTG